MTEPQRILKQLAHDLRSPLMTVRGLASLLSGEADAGKREEYVRQLDAAAGEISEAIRAAEERLKAESPSDSA